MDCLSLSPMRVGTKVSCQALVVPALPRELCRMVRLSGAVELDYLRVVFVGLSQRAKIVGNALLIVR